MPLHSSNMDVTRDCHTKWSKSEREKRNSTWYNLYVESKIWHIWTYLWNRNRIMDIKNRRVAAKVDRGGRRLNWEFEISRCKLVYIEWINNKVLLYTTGNYIQYPVINQNGKEHEKRMYNTHNWVTFLYSRNWHNMVFQLHFNKNTLKKDLCT